MRPKIESMEISVNTDGVSHHLIKHPSLPWYVFVIFFCVGFAPWVTVNGVWLQMSDLVQDTTEKASIAAYLSLSLQLSNIIAFIYVWYQNFRPINHTISILFILIGSIITSLLLSFFWHVQTEVFGQFHSLSLIVLMFFAGMLGCLSVVVYYPWVSLYSLTLTSILSTGMGSSGLVASLVSLIEHPTDDIRTLSVGWFFRVISCLIFVSLICFIIIIKSPTIQKLKRRPYSLTFGDESESMLENSKTNSASKFSMEIVKLAKVSMINQFFICIENYLLMGIINFSVINYPNSEEILIWLNILSMFGGTIGRLISAKLKTYKVTYLTFLQSFLWIFLVFFCFYGTLSVDNFGWVIVVVNTIYSMLYGYTDTVIYLKVSEELPDEYVERGSRLVGLSNQVGAFIGSISSFLIVYFEVVHY